MNNIFLHIVLPKGMRVMSGAALMQDTTIDVVSSLNPFYAGVGQVKLTGGTYLRKTPDLTIACAIYNASQEADLRTPYGFQIPADPETASKFIGARTQWVIAKATSDLMQNLLALTGAPGAKVLANFSVTRSKESDKQGIAAKLGDLAKDLNDFGITLASCATVLPGGRPIARFAAKGAGDFSERTPSRIWTVTGIGVNAKGSDYINPLGGRGKPVNYFQRSYMPQNFFSQAFVNYRSGVFYGTMPLYPNFFLV